MSVDVAVVGWVVWMVGFGVWEWRAVVHDQRTALVDPDSVDAPDEGRTLSALLRRVSNWHPVFKFAMAGAWVWFGVHILYPSAGV